MRRIDFDILINYFSGDATPEDALYIEDWRAQAAENNDYFNQLFAAWNDELHYANPDVEELWQQFQKKTSVVQENFIPKKRKLVWLKAAAGLAVIALAAFAVYQITKPKEILYTTSKVTDSIILPDATNVILEKDASLTFKKDGKNNSLVKLTGNATFTITNHANDFVLELPSGLYIKDVGTHFFVSQQNNKTSVTLYNGKLIAWSGTDTVLMNESGVLTFDNGSKKFEKKNFTGSFDFKDQLVEDICKQVALYYHTRITIQNPQKVQVPLTIQCHDATLDEVAGIIAATLDAEYAKDQNGAITIK